MNFKRTIAFFPSEFTLQELYYLESIGDGEDHVGKDATASWVMLHKDPSFSDHQCK